MIPSMPPVIASGETMHARWASTASHVRVIDELFVLAGGPSAGLALDAIEALATTTDSASRSELRSPPADPLAALLHLTDRRLVERGAGPIALAALRLTPPWATVALAGDVYFAHASTERITRIGGSAPPLGAEGPLVLRYVPLARGDRFVVATVDIDPGRAAAPALPIEERCRGLVSGEDEAAMVIEVV